jgi:hypothetical protein
MYEPLLQFITMFGKAKNFMIKKMLERQLKNAPPEQREMLMTLMEKDPKLLEKISKEIQTEVKAGKSQMAAAMKIMPKYQVQLQKVMGSSLRQTGSSGVRFNPNGSIHK